MKTKCSKCGNQTDSQNLSVREECPDCQRRRNDDEEEYRRSSNQLYNAATGDILNTGIPGGIDMDMTTPM